MIRSLLNSLLYFPARTILETPEEAGLDYRNLAIETEDGERLHGWWVAARNDRLGHLLLCHGNAGNVGDRVLHAQLLTAAGMHVLLFDYRGYGGNPGSPSEQGLALDVRAAHRFLIEQQAVPAERLLYFGESLGAAVVTGLATEHPPAGLLLRSPFVDLASVGREHYPFLPVGLLLRDRFPVAEPLARVRVPTTVIYGTADEVVPAGQSRAVAAAAAGPTRVVEIEGAHHNDAALLDGPELLVAVVDLANRAVPPR